MCIRDRRKSTLDKSFPSTNIIPEFGFKKAVTKPAIVDFPDPEVPTRAVTVPLGASKEISCSTYVSSS